MIIDEIVLEIYLHNNIYDEKQDVLIVKTGNEKHCRFYIVFLVAWKN